VSPCGPIALFDEAALRHNLGVARQRAPSSRIWAVIKADAYGHGLERAAAALATADGFAVARVEEALRLRGSGVEHAILVLGGALSPEEALTAQAHRLDLALHREAQMTWLETLPPGPPLRVWIKVDTGMHRLGLDPAEVPTIQQRLAACPQVAPLPGLMTHLANADDPDDPLTERQCQRLRALARPHQALNIGNSGGLLACPAARADWVRPGIMLYGGSPFAGLSARALGLEPVMTLKTQISAVHHFHAGDRIGYGGTFSCPEDMPVGVAAIGYGDGYPRHAPTGTPVLVAGQRVALIGRVSMDSISLDLRQAPGTQPGDEVLLWGRGLPVEEIAQAAGTINYELLCGLSKRVRRVAMPIPQTISATISGG
jgi:alanine racemase